MTAGPLILGATGQIGRMWQAGAAHLFRSAPIWQSRRPLVGYLHWDILRESAPDLSCSAVISLAGAANDAEKTHLDLAQAACDLGAKLGVPVLLASTQAVYGVQSGALEEGAQCHPASPYGKAKYAMERAVADRADVTCLRIGNVIGADQLLAAARKGPVPLDQFADGAGPLRSMIGAQTLAAVCAGLLALPTRPKIVNVAQPGLVSMQSLLEAGGADWPDWFWRPAPETAVPRLELDVALLTSLVDVPPADPATLLAEARACGAMP